MWNKKLIKKNKCGKFAKSAVVIFVLIIVIICQFAIMLNLLYEQNVPLPTLLSENIFWSMAISLVVSLFFLFFAKWIIPANNDDNRAGDLTELIAHVRTRTPRYSPIYTYDAFDEPNVEFNRRMNKEVIKSKVFKHMGDKAEYLSYRLDLIKNSIEERGYKLKIEILLPNIYTDKFVSGRLQTLQSRGNYRKVSGVTDTLEYIVKDQRKIIINTMNNIRKLSHYYDFKIVLYDELPYMRYEILDDLLILSFLAMSPEKYCAPTFMYSGNSLFYNSYNRNFEELMGLYGKNSEMVFDNNSLTKERLVTICRDFGFTEQETKKFVGK